MNSSPTYDATSASDEFARRLLAWFDDHGRHDLPWQRDATPYHVWLSEIMLQQTQVATVIPYYERFTAAFPTVEDLARAGIDDVLHRWSGLGYYARARNLHAAAKRIVAEHGGAFPADLDALQALPGVGRSTAGAILSTALDGRAAILDGNVKRVLARFHAVEGWPGQAAVARELWALAEEHTPRERVAAYTQAIMDLGATVCTRARPACERCPVAAGCAARAADRQTDFPGRKPRKALPTRRTVFLLACSPSGGLYLERRPPQGLWGGLWCFPELARIEDLEDFCLRRLDASVREWEELPGLRHSFSHYHLEIRPVLAALERDSTAVAEGRELRAWPVRDYPRVGLAAPVARIWRQAAGIITGAEASENDREAIKQRRLAL